MKILGIDFGEKRIGLALADEEGMIASGIESIDCNGKEIEKIVEIVTKNQVGKIVYGIPLKMDGSMSPMGEKIIGFINKLKEIIKIECTQWDERFTSKEAENILITANLSRKKRKKIIDRLSAQIILQDYLDSQIFKNTPIQE